MSSETGPALPFGFRTKQNLRFRLKGWPLRVEASAPDGGFVLRDGSDTIHIARWRRYRRYTSGIRAHIDKVAGEYMLGQVPFSRGDVVIDCGANIGEVGIYLKPFGVDYRPFEPEPIEADCCDRNVFGGEARTIRKGLWHETTELVFYSQPNSADSSLIDSGRARQNFRVPVITLDEYIAAEGIERIRLLKLEAEGAEPEVLKGAAHSLHKIEWIAADGGPERGASKERTMAAMTNHLLKNGFEMVDCRDKRLCALFRNVSSAA